MVTPGSQTGCNIAVYGSICYAIGYLFQSLDSKSYTVQELDRVRWVFFLVRLPNLMENTLKHFNVKLIALPKVFETI